MIKQKFQDKKEQNFQSGILLQLKLLERVLLERWGYASGQKWERLLL